MTDPDARSVIPTPFDQCPSAMGARIHPATPLTAGQRRFVLSTFPRGATIENAQPSARYYGLGYPIWVTVRAGARQYTALLRRDSFRGGA